MGIAVIPPSDQQLDPEADLRREVVKMLYAYPVLVRALADFRLQKKDGILELHFTHGGVTSATLRQVKVYKP